jgi:hypothetical protein
MSTFYFTVNLDNQCTLCLAPLTNRRIEESGQDIPDPSGYFLYEKRHQGATDEIEILAQVMSDEAAFRLKDLFRMT